MKNTLLGLLFAALILPLAALTQTGCQDGNLFGKLGQRGHSGDTETLLADAQIALRQQDYAGALSIYENVLSRDPNNAQALYGAAAAELGLSGLSLGQIVANLFGQGVGASAAAVSVSGLTEMIQQALVGGMSGATIHHDSILNGIDIYRLDDRINRIICRLQRIVSGTSDGSIAPNDPDVLINLGILSIIRAALRPIIEEYFDIRNDGGTYKVEQLAGFNDICGNAPMMSGVVFDLAGAYACINRVVTRLGLSPGKALSILRDDIAWVTEELFDTVGATAEPCPTTLTGVGITKATYKNYTGIFDPPAGC